MLEIKYQNIIKDSEGNYLFNLNSYTNQKQFACDISVNSVLPSSKQDNNNTDDDNNNDPKRKYYKNYYKGGSNGLSGGAIAAIIICVIIALAIVAAFIVFSRKKTKAPIDTTVGTNSSLSHFAYNPGKKDEN